MEFFGGAVNLDMIIAIFLLWRFEVADFDFM